MNIKIQDCFTESGMLKFDSYRTGLRSLKAATRLIILLDSNYHER